MAGHSMPSAKQAADRYEAITKASRVMGGPYGYTPSVFTKSDHLILPLAALVTCVPRFLGMILGIALAVVAGLAPSTPAIVLIVGMVCALVYVQKLVGTYQEVSDGRRGVTRAPASLHRVSDDKGGTEECQRCKHAVFRTDVVGLRERTTVEKLREARWCEQCQETELDAIKQEFMKTPGDVSDILEMERRIDYFLGGLESAEGKRMIASGWSLAPSKSQALLEGFGQGDKPKIKGDRAVRREMMEGVLDKTPEQLAAEVIGAGLRAADRGQVVREYGFVIVPDERLRQLKDAYVRGHVSEQALKQVYEGLMGSEAQRLWAERTMDDIVRRSTGGPLGYAHPGTCVECGESGIHVNCDGGARRKASEDRVPTKAELGRKRAAKKPAPRKSTPVKKVGTKASSELVPPGPLRLTAKQVGRDAELGAA